MKRYDKIYDIVQDALTDGSAVCALTADGKSNVCINPQESGKSGYLKCWTIGLLIVYENGTRKFDEPDIDSVVELYRTEDTSLDSMRDVIDIFLTLTNKDTIDIIQV